MPTYQYKCLNCDYRFEEFQLITEEPLEKCPQCEGAAERIISGGAGFIFKGSGFYITDYRSSNYKKDAENDKPKPSVSTPKSDNKTKSSKDSVKSNNKPQTASKSDKN